MLTVGTAKSRFLAYTFYRPIRL